MKNITDEINNLNALILQQKILINTNYVFYNKNNLNKLYDDSIRYRQKLKNLMKKELRINKLNNILNE